MKRPKRNCIFCGGTAGSKEHALPDWLAKAMQLQNEPTLPALFSSLEGWKTEGKERATGKLITKRICHTCNTGWMCELEAKVKSIIAEWVRPGFAGLNHEALAVDSDSLAVLSRWLLKTGLCLNEVAPRGTMGKFPAEAPQWAHENVVPNSCKIYAGWVREPDFGMKLSRGFRIFNGGKFHPNQIHRHSFDFTLQLNHLAIRIANMPDADWMVMTCRNTEGVLCSPCFWSHGGCNLGDDGDSCSFDSLEQFSKVCIVTTLPVPPIHPEEALKASASLQRLLP